MAQEYSIGEIKDGNFIENTGWANEAARDIIDTREDVITGANRRAITPQLGSFDEIINYMDENIKPLDYIDFKAVTFQRNLNNSTNEVIPNENFSENIAKKIIDDTDVAILLNGEEHTYNNPENYELDECLASEITYN